MAMELTNAQRQARHRQKQKFEEKNCRINTWLDAAAMVALENLAKGHGATKKNVLEALLMAFKEDLFFNEKLADISKKPGNVAKKARKT